MLHFEIDKGLSLGLILKNKKLLSSLFLCMLIPQVSYADYEKDTGKIEQIYIIENGTNVFGIRIKLKELEPESKANCDEWYIKMNSPLRDQMYSLALSIQAQGKQVTLMKKNNTENIESSGTICGLHRIYSVS